MHARTHTRTHKSTHCCPHTSKTILASSSVRRIKSKTIQIHTTMDTYGGYGTDQRHQQRISHDHPAVNRQKISPNTCTGQKEGKGNMGNSVETNVVLHDIRKYGKLIETHSQATKNLEVQMSQSKSSTRRIHNQNFIGTQSVMPTKAILRRNTFSVRRESLMKTQIIQK